MKKIVFFILLFISLSLTAYAEGRESKEFPIAQKYIFYKLVNSKVRVEEIINIESMVWDLPGQFEFEETLPEDFYDFNITGVEEYNLSDRQFSAIIRSNSEEITHFSYSYYPAGLSDSFLFKSNYRIQALDIFIPMDLEIELKDSSLLSDGAYTFGDKLYIHYKTEQVQPGKLFKPEIIPYSGNLGTIYSRISKKSPEFHSAGHIRLWEQTPFSGMNPHLFLIVILLLVSGAAFLVIRRNVLMCKDPQESERRDDLLFEGLYSKKQAVLKKILNLENDYQKKIISADHYQAARSNLKIELIKIKLKINQLISIEPGNSNDTNR